MNVQWTFRARPDRGAELSAACGRCSEAKHGQSKEKASICAAFDYAIAHGQGSREESLSLRQQYNTSHVFI